MRIQGVFIPVITPFRDGVIDEQSYLGLLDHYAGKGISGLIPCATTGESPVLDEDEVLRLADCTLERTGGKVPVYFGASGYDTAKLVKHVKMLESRGVKGILSASPYYNRPDQRGIFEHFRKISESTSMDIIIYNIPYRTGRNVENDTIRRLAELVNIVGIKDSCGDIRQTSELLLDPPPDFSILTGEDALFFTTLALGGDGGILAAAHVETSMFLSVFSLMKKNDHEGALEVWRQLFRFIPLLFAEPNPAPLKYILKKRGLIYSDELRLPLVGISDDMRSKLDAFF